VILQVSIRVDEPAAVRRLCLGVDKEHGLQLALFEAANVQKNIVGMSHARLHSMLVDKTNRLQKNGSDQCRLVRVRDI
jgi:hypothetical protein